MRAVKIVNSTRLYAVFQIHAPVQNRVKKIQKILIVAFIGITDISSSEYR